MDHRATQITLPDGTQTDTWAKEYMYYCEALSFSRKTLKFRREMIAKIERRGHTERLNRVKYWLRHIWEKKRLSVDSATHNSQ